LHGVVHHGPVFQWLAQGTSMRLVDMASSGSLAGALDDVFGEALSVNESVMLHRTRNAAKRRFSWEELVPQYLEMYRSAAGDRQTRKNENLESRKKRAAL
jgi:glycogen synthase